jgi:hypothetical protein
MLSIALSVAMHATGAVALPEPKVTITYSLETADEGAYFQKISDTPSNLGDVDYVFDVLDSGDPDVNVFVASPLHVTIEFTADVPGGNIVDGPVELVDTHFEREFEINASGLTLVHTTISTMLARKGTGTLSGSTITWENLVAPYQESVIGESTCSGFGCLFVEDPFPRDLTGTFDVPLPTFTVLTDTIFGDSFASDNGTPGDPSDDIDRPDVDATVKDTWVGIEVPEPSREILLLAGALGLVGLARLRERGDRRRSLREPSLIGFGLGDHAGPHRR